MWSADEDRAFDLAARLEAGYVFVNTHNRTGMSLRAPFGGVKRSGYGREYGEEGLLEYVQSAVVHAPRGLPRRRRQPARDRLPGLTSTDPVLVSLPGRPRLRTGARGGRPPGRCPGRRAG
ncbi:aldehyde dehydrogenase family protein [Nonomuraea ferruginea]